MHTCWPICARYKCELHQILAVHSQWTGCLSDLPCWYCVGYRHHLLQFQGEPSLRALRQADLHVCSACHLTVLSMPMRLCYACWIATPIISKASTNGLRVTAEQNQVKCGGGSTPSPSPRPSSPSSPTHTPSTPSSGTCLCFMCLGAAAHSPA